MRFIFSLFFRSCAWSAFWSVDGRWSIVQGVKNRKQTREHLQDANRASQKSCFIAHSTWPKQRWCPTIERRSLLRRLMLVHSSIPRLRLAFNIGGWVRPKYLKPAYPGVAYGALPDAAEWGNWTQSIECPRPFFSFHLFFFWKKKELAIVQTAELICRRLFRNPVTVRLEACLSVNLFSFYFSSSYLSSVESVVTNRVRRCGGFLFKNLQFAPNGWKRCTNRLTTNSPG